MHTGYVNSTPTVSTIAYIMSILFLLSFPDFLVIFLLITILRNLNRPCKLYLNIINMYTLCLSFFSWFFPEFLIIFVLITILGSVHRPCKQYPNIITTIPIFCLFYYYFSCESAKFPYLAFLAQFLSLDSSAIPVTRLWGPFQCKYWNDTILWQEWNFGW